jgi:hypothetical protein
MINDLNTSLRALIEDKSDAVTEFERPVETYKPAQDTINLFLYDVRENTELRNNEPIVERQNGTVTVRRPPVRVACSYLVTAWADPASTGETGILKQHQLLSEVFQILARSPFIEQKYLQGELQTQQYPIPLVTVQGELMRNPAEFWTALGGKLRSSITLTATIAMDQSTEAMEAKEVVTHDVRIRANALGKEFFRIGGTVRDASTQEAIGDVEITVMESAVKTKTNSAGLYSVTIEVAGHYSIKGVRQGYRDETIVVEVPGNGPTDFDIDLSAIN